MKTIHAAFVATLIVIMGGLLIWGVLSIPKPEEKPAVSVENERFVLDNSTYFRNTPAVDYVVVITDKKTNVQYLVVSRSGHIAITPLLK